MRLIIIILLIGVITAGAIYFAADFIFPYPRETAEQYVESIIEGNYSQMADLHHPELEQPTIESISNSFQEFSDAFGVTEIEIVSLEAQENLDRPALSRWWAFELELLYKSEYFPDKNVNIDLNLSKNFSLSLDSFFTWKIHWQDQIPLPGYGLEADYERSILMPARGNIYDRNGEMLAGEGSVINIGIQPGRIEDSELLLSTLEEELGLSEEYVRGEYEAPGVQEHWFVPLTTVSEEKFQELDPILRPIPGIFFRREESRVYPQDETTGHLTGYLGEVTAEMKENHPERNYQTGEKVGRSGLEIGLEDILRGNVGYQFSVQNRTGQNDNQQDIISEVEPIDGQDIYTSIDLPLQQKARNALQDENGALVAADADSGEILTMASTPGYNPNEFVQGISQERWADLSTDPDQPLFNRAAQGRYPPGSTFKALTAAAALDLDIFNIESQFEESGELTVEGNVIRNFQEEIFQEHTLEDAVVNSINTTMAKVGLELGAENLSEYFSRFKFNQSPDISLPANTGQLGNPEQSQVNLAWSAIGQGQVLMTPLQMTKLFAVFANGGYLPELSIVTEKLNRDRERILEETTIEAMDIMLEKVVTEGTGQPAALETPEDENEVEPESANSLTVYGKTGTAEVTGQEPHAWFAGYIRDVSDRNIAFAVMLEEAGVGGENAAPVARNFIETVRTEEIISDLEEPDELDEIEIE